jgi:hypothetical protein
MNTIANKAVDGVTLGYIKGVDKMKNLSLKRGDERGDIVQTIIIISIFVVIVLVVGKIVYDAVRSAATKTGSCIKNANLVKQSNNTTGC